GNVDERMPPKTDPLSREQVKVLQAWITQGAKWPDAAVAPAGRREMVVTDDDRRHWSYRPLTMVKLPMVRDADWWRKSVDRFIVAALEARKIRPNTSADRRTLIRRLSFDLLGLPPTPEEVEKFAADTRPTAYAELVERMLASPHYGERWGRHWLDL